MSVTTLNPGEKWTAARANTKIEAPVLLSELAAEVTNAWEDALGNPASNGYVLTSTAAGVRSWTNPASLGFQNPMTTLGDLIYGGAAGAATRLPGNTTTAKQFLTQTGDGTASAAPAWGALVSGDVTTALGFTPFANPMTTSQDLIVGGASGAASRLAVGTNTHVLTVVGGNVTWAAPSMSNPMTTAGDLVIGGASGVPTRLAAGTNGHVLTLVSGSPAWVAAGAGSFDSAADYTLTGQWTWGNSAGTNWRIRIWREAISTTVGTATQASIQLAPWNRPTNGQYSGEIQWGVDPASSTYAPVTMGVRWDNSATMGMGAWFVATRADTASATAPNIRLVVEANGNITHTPAANGYLNTPQLFNGYVTGGTTMGSLNQSAVVIGMTARTANQVGNIAFAADRTGTYGAAGITYLQTDGGSAAGDTGYGDLIFWSKAVVGGATSPTERMRITASGTTVFSGQVRLLAQAIVIRDSGDTATLAQFASTGAVTAVTVTATGASAALWTTDRSDAAKPWGWYANSDVLYLYRGADKLTYTTGGLLSTLSSHHIGTLSGTNNFQTLGITIWQGGNDNEILSLKSSDVAHGMTTLTDTDTYAFARKVGANDGGLEVYGLTETTRAVNIVGVATAENATRSTAGTAYVEIAGLLKSTTTTTTPGADKNLLAIRAGTTTRFIFDTDGDLHADAGVNANAYDAYDDVTLSRALTLALDPKGLVRSRFDEYVGYNRRHLAEAGILSDGGFINYSALARLNMGATWQLHQRVAVLEEEADELTLAKRRITELEREVAWLKYGLEERTN